MQSYICRWMWHSLDTAIWNLRPLTGYLQMRVWGLVVKALNASQACSQELNQTPLGGSHRMIVWWKWNHAPFLRKRGLETDHHFTEYNDVPISSASVYYFVRQLWSIFAVYDWLHVQSWGNHRSSVSRSLMNDSKLV